MPPIEPTKVFPKPAPHANSRIFGSKDAEKPTEETSRQPDGISRERSGVSVKERPELTFLECHVVSKTKHANDWVPAYTPSLISSLLVVLGWFVVNKTQANRERRKQIREFVGMLIDILAELEISIIEYHTKKRDETLEQTLISRLTRFEKACARLPNFLSNQWPFLKAAKVNRVKVDPYLIQEMRKAMTLKHFLDEHDRPLPRSDPLILEIQNTTDVVQDSLESVRLASLD